MRSSEWVADPLAAHCSISRVGPRIRSMCFCIRRFEMDSIPLRSLALGFVSGRSDICRIRLGARGLGIDADRFLVLLLRSFYFCLETCFPFVQVCEIAAVCVSWRLIVSSAISLGCILLKLALFSHSAASRNRARAEVAS